MRLYVLKPSLIWNGDAPLKVGVRPQEVLVEDFNVFPVQIVKNRDFFLFLLPTSPSPFLLPSSHPAPPTAQVPVTVAVAGTRTCTAVRYPRYAVLLSDGNISKKVSPHVSLLHYIFPPQFVFCTHHCLIFSFYLPRTLQPTSSSPLRLPFYFLTVEVVTC